MIFFLNTKTIFANLSIPDGAITPSRINFILQNSRMVKISRNENRKTFHFPSNKSIPANRKPSKEDELQISFYSPMNDLIPPQFKLLEKNISLYLFWIKKFTDENKLRDNRQFHETQKNRLKSILGKAAWSAIFVFLGVTRFCAFDRLQLMANRKITF